MKYYLYSLSVGKVIYYGITKNVTKRMYCHKARFNKTIDGWSYPVYNGLRKVTKSWQNITISIISTHRTREKAILAEERMIELGGNLNCQKKGR